MYYYNVVPQSRDRASCGKADQVAGDCRQIAGAACDEIDLCKDMDGYQGTLKYKKHKYQKFFI